MTVVERVISLAGFGTSGLRGRLRQRWRGGQTEPDEDCQRGAREAKKVETYGSARWALRGLGGKANVVIYSGQGHALSTWSKSAGGRCGGPVSWVLEG